MTALLIIMGVGVGLLLAAYFGSTQFAPTRPIQPSDHSKLGLYKVILNAIGLLVNLAFIGICVVLVWSIWPDRLDLRIGLVLVAVVAALSALANLTKSVLGIRDGSRLARL